MRVVTRGAEKRPLLRLDYGGSFEYIEFVIRPDANDAVRIVDWAPLRENFAKHATFTKFIDSPQFKKWLHE